MTDVQDNRRDDQDASIERMLREALRTEPLSESAMLRLRDAASSELTRAAKPQAADVARRWLWAAAAALVGILLGTVWLIRPVGHLQPFGVVARADAGEGEVTQGWLHHQALKAGVALQVGDVLTSHGAILITLAAGGTLRVAPDTVLQLTSVSGTALRRGIIYLDFPPVLHPSSFDVATRVGTVEHVGTEFEVLSDQQLVRIRVREGRVRLKSQAKETLVEAGTQLTASRDGSLSSSAINVYGRDWLWVTALAPDYEIEGQPLVNFLQWAARELGRSLQFSDAHAREVAERTVLHGSVKGRDPMDALSSVLSTTSLTYEVRGNTIWIQSAHGT